MLERSLEPAVAADVLSVLLLAGSKRDSELASRQDLSAANFGMSGYQSLRSMRALTPPHSIGPVPSAWHVDRMWKSQLSDLVAGAVRIAVRSLLEARAARIVPLAEPSTNHQDEGMLISGVPSFAREMDRFEEDVRNGTCMRVARDRYDSLSNLVQV